MSVSPPVLDQFKALIRRHEMRENAAIMNQHKGTSDIWFFSNTQMKMVFLLLFSSHVSMIY